MVEEIQTTPKQEVTNEPTTPSPEPTKLQRLLEPREEDEYPHDDTVSALTDKGSVSKQLNNNIVNPNVVLNKKNAPIFHGKENETIFTWLHFIKTILTSNGIEKKLWVSLVLPQLKDGALDTAVNFTLNNKVEKLGLF